VLGRVTSPPVGLPPPPRSKTPAAQTPARESPSGGGAGARRPREGRLTLHQDGRPPQQDGQDQVPDTGARTAPTNRTPDDREGVDLVKLSRPLPAASRFFWSVCCHSGLERRPPPRGTRRLRWAEGEDPVGRLANLSPRRAAVRRTSGPRGPGLQGAQVHPRRGRVSLSRSCPAGREGSFSRRSTRCASRSGFPGSRRARRETY